MTVTGTQMLGTFAQAPKISNILPFNCGHLWSNVTSHQKTHNTESDSIFCC